MFTKIKSTLPLFIFLVIILAACDTGPKFVAPEIDPPADLIPGYVPEGYTLTSGFQLTTDIFSADIALGDTGRMVGRMMLGDITFNLKSPTGNVVQGIYYKGKQHLILITKSYFPDKSLDDWLAVYEESQPKPCECDCPGLLRLDAFPLPSRFDEFQEERTIYGTRVAILHGPLGWTTVFVRGDYLLTVESGISLDENLKIVASLMND
jgi:hypothetical protein